MHIYICTYIHAYMGHYWEVGGTRLETPSNSAAQKYLSRAPHYRYMRETQVGTVMSTVSSISRFQTVLFPQYSANLSIMSTNMTFQCGKLNRSMQHIMCHRLLMRISMHALSLCIRVHAAYMHSCMRYAYIWRACTVHDCKHMHAACVRTGIHDMHDCVTIKYLHP